MSFKQAQDRLREGYLYTQIEVTDDLNLILFNSIFWKHSKRNNQQYQWFPNIFDHLPLLLNYRLKIPHYQKHPPTPKKKKAPHKNNRHSYSTYETLKSSLKCVERSRLQRVVLSWHIWTGKLSNPKKKSTSIWQVIIFSQQMG